MPTIDDLLMQITRRKVVFDRDELLKATFNAGYEAMEKSGYSPRYIIRFMKRDLMTTVRVADWLYRQDNQISILYTDLDEMFEEETEDEDDEDEDNSDFEEDGDDGQGI